MARTLDNPYLDRYLRSFRERTGQSLIPKAGGFDQMVDVLKSGRVLGFLADQDAGQRGLYVEFFGRQVGVPVRIVSVGPDRGQTILVPVH